MTGHYRQPSVRRDGVFFVSRAAQVCPGRTSGRNVSVFCAYAEVMTTSVTGCIRSQSNRMFPASRYRVAVRDSKNPEGPALLITPKAFTQFTQDAAQGRYDTP